MKIIVMGKVISDSKRCRKILCDGWIDGIFFTFLLKKLSTLIY